MNRCLNDIFSYCKTKPNASVEETTVHFIDLGGKMASQKLLITQCKRDHHTCLDKIQQNALVTAGQSLPPSKRRRVKSLD